MLPLRVGVNLHPQRLSYTQFAEVVNRLDGLGVDTIWNWDHFFPLDGDPQAHPLEAWTLLSAMATLTRHAEIGCLVTCAGFRNPSLLASMAKTVDVISRGRLILGLGAGWFERDFREYGYIFENAAQRLTALEMAIPILKQRWQKDLPGPVRNPIPILIGGGGETITLKIVAQYANIWNSFGPAESYRRKRAILNNWCTSIGRDASEIEHSVLLMPHDLSHLDTFLDAGATHIIMTLPEPWDLRIVEALLHWRDNHHAATTQEDKESKA